MVVSYAESHLEVTLVTLLLMLMPIFSARPIYITTV